MTKLEILAHLNKLDKWTIVEVIESSHSVKNFMKNLKKELHMVIPEELAKEVYVQHYQEYSRS